MGNFKAKMFNKRASNAKNNPDKIIEVIGLKPSQRIADIGSGGGYFSLRFAGIVGEKGRVYAIDINQEFLDLIKNNAKEKRLNNIVTILVEDKLVLPEVSLDFIFMRNVTHHIPNRVKYFISLKKYLKSDGNIIIIEYNKEKPLTFKGMFGHYVSREAIKKEMEEAGYKLEKNFDFLPEQHFTVYSKLLD